MRLINTPFSEPIVERCVLEPYRRALHVLGELEAMNTRSGQDNPVLLDAIGLLQINLEVLEVRCGMLLK
jgi:hypothetical protein